MSDLLLEPLRLPYMQRAMAEVLLLGVLTGAAGVFVVLRRLAFMTDALTHTVFPGVVIAHLAGWSLAVGALAFGVLTAVLLTILAANRRVASDAAIAIVLTALFSVGVVLVSRQRSYTSDLTLFLFGRILTVDRADLLTTLALTVVVLTALAVIGKELLLRSFDPEGATAMGYPGVALDLALNLLIALVVVAAVKAVGTVLVVAMLIVPAASARLLAGRVAGMTVLACLIGVLAGWGGLLISYHLSVSGGVRLAAGATIVVVLVAGFLAVLAATAVRRWRSQPPRLGGSGGAKFAPSVDQAGSGGAKFAPPVEQAS
jgi:manganese/iron transport system permease protein